MADNPISPNKQSPSSTVKRQPRTLASAEEHEQFVRDFSPELILTFPDFPDPFLQQTIIQIGRITKMSFVNALVKAAKKRAFHQLNYTPKTMLV